MCFVPVPGGMTLPVGTVNAACGWSKPVMASGWPERPLANARVPASL